MRTRCNTPDCNNPLTPSARPGARSVYCPSCDRAAARERMRSLRTHRALNAAESTYYRPRHGDIYVIYNPAYPGWVKVGCALDATDRLNSFQTATPYRNFSLRWSKRTRDKLTTESLCHERLAKTYERKGEWFRTQPSKAIRILERLPLWQN